MTDYIEYFLIFSIKSSGCILNDIHFDLHSNFFAISSQGYLVKLFVALLISLNGLLV